METGRPCFVEHFSKEKDEKGFSQEIKDLAVGLESMVAWPLMLDGKTVAALRLDSPSIGLFKESDERLKTLLRSIASLFEHAFKVLRVEIDPHGPIVPEREAEGSIEEDSSSVGPPSTIIAFDPRFVTPDDYARLVSALGDIVRAEGGSGLVHLRTDGYDLVSTKEPVAQ